MHLHPVADLIRNRWRHKPHYASFAVDRSTGTGCTGKAPVSCCRSTKSGPVGIPSRTFSSVMRLRQGSPESDRPGRQRRSESGTLSTNICKAAKLLRLRWTGRRTSPIQPLLSAASCNRRERRSSRCLNGAITTATATQRSDWSTAQNTSFSFAARSMMSRSSAIPCRETAGG